MHDVDIAQGEILEIIPGLFWEPPDLGVTLAIDVVMLRPPRARGWTPQDLLRASDAWHAAHGRREAARQRHRARERACASTWGLSLAAA